MPRVWIEPLIELLLDVYRTQGEAVTRRGERPRVRASRRPLHDSINVGLKFIDAGIAYPAPVMGDFRLKPGLVQSGVLLCGQPYTLDAADFFQLAKAQVSIVIGNDSRAKMGQQKAVEFLRVECRIATVQFMEVYKYKFIGVFLQETNQLHDQVFKRAR
ncbi:hypothetical protein D3C86_631090 [compost metagenome]